MVVFFIIAVIIFLGPLPPINMTVADYYGRDGIVVFEINQVSNQYGEILVDCLGLATNNNCSTYLKCKSPDYSNVAMILLYSCS